MYKIQYGDNPNENFDNHYSKYLQDEDGEHNGINEPNSDNNNEDNNISVWEQYVYSIAKPKKYLEMLEMKTGKHVKYYILLILLAAIMTFVVPSIAVIAGFGGFNKLFKETLPEFSITDGKFVSEDKFDILISGMHFYVDAKEAEVNDSDLQDSGVYITMGSSVIKVLVREAGQSTEIYRIGVSSLFSEGFNNEQAANMTPYFYTSLVIAFIFSTCQIAVRYLFLAFIYMIIASALNKNTGLNLTTKKVYMMCIYAQTLGITIVNVNLAFGCIIPSGIVSVVGIFATYHYISAVFKPYFRNKIED